MRYLFKRVFFDDFMTSREDRQIFPQNLIRMFQEKITELQEEPEFARDQRIPYARENETPEVKVAVGNVSLDHDLWKELRNPAVVGLYPAGLQQIWEFFAHKRKTGTDESGRPTIFQVPRSFGSALQIYNRAVIISVMLPFSTEIVRNYTESVIGKEKSSSHVYAAMYEEVNLLLDKATTRAAIDLVADDNVVIPMNNDNVAHVSEEAVPLTRQGTSHGPSKGGNYPQKSVAALLGLGQFGVHRIIFKDEMNNGKIERFTGPLRSIIVFDKNDIITNGNNDVIYITDSWRSFLLRLFDFTDTDPEINKYRFCAYIPYHDEGCTKCRDVCPSGAQPNSMPSPTGEYPEEVATQAHRFWEGKLQFDHARCCEERGQMAELFPEWSCSRGLSVCKARGVRRVYAAKNFYKKRAALTKE